MSSPGTDSMEKTPFTRPNRSRILCKPSLNLTWSTRKPEPLRSEDSIRRSFARVNYDEATYWMDLHLNRTCKPLLGRAWMLDLDETVKLLYGEQESARPGHKPHKPACATGVVGMAGRTRPALLGGMWRMPPRR